MGIGRNVVVVFGVSCQDSISSNLVPQCKIKDSGSDKYSISSFSFLKSYSYDNKVIVTFFESSRSNSLYDNP